MHVNIYIGSNLFLSTIFFNIWCDVLSPNPVLIDTCENIPVHITTMIEPESESLI